METLYITHPIFYLHEMGPDHPESPQRLQTLDQQLRRQGYVDYMRTLTALKATEQDLLRVHSLHHLAKLQRLTPESGYQPIDADTTLNPYTLEAAHYAAGAGILAVDEIFAGRAKTAFCAVRPPGHHACYDKAMGFCFFNNVAVAAAYAIEKYGVERITIVDFDVHHGNGTEDIFAHQAQIQMLGFYQFPFYPNVRHVPPADNMHNEALAAHTDTAVIKELVTTQWLPLLHAFQPQLLLFSAGFDAHQDDPMAQFNLTEADYAWMTQQLVDATQSSTQGRVISMLEGGYAPLAMANSALAHLDVLIKSVAS